MFFTAGYSGRDVEELIATLLDAEVSSVVDIRHSPVSAFRPEYSKRNLEARLDEAGIMYVHVRALGVPREIRERAVDTGTRNAIWEWYDTYVIPEMLGRNLHSFLNLADGHMALLCVEMDPTACHRHRLSLALERRGINGFDL